jgi:ATP-binding cassette subfamily F protein 3
VINVKDLTFWYGDRCIFDAVSFSVPENSKVGLVGPNGAGKSTLLNILSDKEPVDGGKIKVFGTISMVPQEVKRDPDMEASPSVRSYLDPGNNNPDHALRKLLDGLEFSSLALKDTPKNLSGGQKTKLALARALLAEPDVLLLDEPTNFMDVGGKQWVMNFLSGYPKTLILISHDLNLLDKYIDKVLEINQYTRKVDQYSGNYTDYLRLKKGRGDLLRRQVAVGEHHIKSMEEGLKKLARYSSKKGVRARVNLKHRIELAKDILPELPPELKRIKIRIPEPAWVGREALKAVNVKKSYGDKEVLSGISLSIERGERVAIIGRNGAGKSTFIRILMGFLTADAGEVVRG